MTCQLLDALLQLLGGDFRLLEWRAFDAMRQSQFRGECNIVIGDLGAALERGLRTRVILRNISAKRQYSKRQGVHLPNFDRQVVEKVISYCGTLGRNLIALRDRAFILTLVDTGLRISEACSLQRGDIDWNEGRTLIIGKGNKQDVVRFSDRSMKALKDYLAARALLDGESGKPLTSLPSLPATIEVPDGKSNR